jgi:GAF domain-containing protein
MFDFQPDTGTHTPERYRQLCLAADALTHGESDSIANMANCAALIWEFLPDLNWAGFYRMVGADETRALVLGPFIGRPACIRIELGRGVCGAAAQQMQTQLVEDVHEFPGHIPCDAASKSELVVPVVRDGNVIAVIDCDSPLSARFTAEDAAGLEELAKLLSDRI